MGFGIVDSDSQWSCCTWNLNVFDLCNFRHCPGPAFASSKRLKIKHKYAMSTDKCYERYIKGGFTLTAFLLVLGTRSRATPTAAQGASRPSCPTILELGDAQTSRACIPIFALCSGVKTESYGVVNERISMLQPGQHPRRL